MNGRENLRLVGLFVIAAMAAWVGTRRPAIKSAPESGTPPPAPVQPAASAAGADHPVRLSSPPISEVPSRPQPASPATNSQPPPPLMTPNSGAKAKPALLDPLAREALALVGLEPEAEDYWFAAINDPTLPAHERQDLIEDLNEDGISDPDHPTLEDLPLILSRLELVELLGPYAMDQVNADAFAEAHKDLVNLFNQLTQ